MFQKLSILAILFFVTIPSLCSATEIQADEYLIQYTGRINFENPKSPIMYWSGSYIRARFEGTSIAAILEDSSGRDSLHVQIDNGEPTTLRLKKGKDTYQIAEGLPDGKHEILLYKRTEFSVGSITFSGFILDEGKKLVYPLYRPFRRIEYYGDSITCGMGNEDESRKNNSDMSFENNYMTYAAMTARNLKAEHVCISQSGIGFMVSWFPQIMPDIFDRINPNDPRSKWDFTKWLPDVVVINLGTNDSWRITQYNQKPTDEEIVKAYVDFVSSIARKYPEAEFFCTLGNMNSTAEGAPFPKYIDRAVDMLNQKYEKNRFHCVIFPYKKTDGHPTISEHKAIADQLTKEIKEVMKW